MSWNLPIYLNIRKKVLIGFTAGLLVTGAIGAISFSYLREIELKQHFVEIADDLSNIILEMRRYEKNYLLYGSLGDLRENQDYIRQGIKVLGEIAPAIKGLEGGRLLVAIERELMAYSAVVEQIPCRASQENQTIDPYVEEQLRERGKTLVDLSQQLVTLERERILNIILTLKTQLLSSLGIFLLLGAFLDVIVGKKIITPLRKIEKTTHRIAQGDFRQIPVPDTRDETQRVVEAFNKMVAELEKRQDQLLQARKLSSLGILTSGIAHQLNNPLNNISTSCQILLEELDQADLQLLRKMLSNIEQEVYRARDIVKGLLEFSRAREFCLAPAALSEVVERSVKLISSQVPPGIEINREVPDNLVLNLDAQRMQQVFLNLIMNAIQAIGSPSGEIRIKAGRAPGKEETVIQVEDTGAGIAEKDLGRVFDPFFTTKEVGTGLGLSIVYGIIEQHRGTISVESRQGEGTRFTIRLPNNPQESA